MSKRILVVEDNIDNLTLIGEILRAFGYTYLIARDGLEAIEIVTRERPDLILMDLSLPRMDGWQASRQIKANPDLSAIPIIALTAHAMRGDREKAIEAGCDDYITKPINLSALTEKLKHYLGAGK